MGHVSCKGICSENTVWSNRHTHAHTVDTGNFPSCFDALRWGVRLGWGAQSCHCEWCALVSVFLSSTLSHTHSHWVILFSSYSHALASFLSRAGSIPQTKFNLANLQRRLNCLQIHHCEQKPVCSRQTGVCSLHDVQVRWANFGVVLWKTKMEVKNFRAQMMHMRKCIPSRDLVIKLRGTRVIVNKF